MGYQRGTGLSIAADDVEDSRGKQVLGKLGQVQGRHRGGVSGLEHHRVAGSERRCNTGGRELDRVVERDDPAHHPVGLSNAQVETAARHLDGRPLDLAGQPGEVAKGSHRVLHVLLHAGDRNPRIHRVDAGEGLAVGLDAVGERLQRVGTSLPAHGTPRLCAGRCGIDGVSDVGRACPRHFGELLLCAGVHTETGATVARTHPGPTDVHLVALADARAGTSVRAGLPCPLVVSCRAHDLLPRELVCDRVDLSARAHRAKGPSGVAPPGDRGVRIVQPKLGTMEQVGVRRHAGASVHDLTVEDLEVSTVQGNPSSSGAARGRLRMRSCSRSRRVWPARSGRG